MTEIEKNEYKKAYVELYEIIKKMSLQERQKIPKEFVKNLYDEMDKNYKFEFDNNKDILEQNFRLETKALLVELYEKYLASEEEKDFWKKYDKICLNRIEEDKKEKYASNIIFTNADKKSSTNKTDDKLPVKVEDQNIFAKFIKSIKNIFHLN